MPDSRCIMIHRHLAVVINVRCQLKLSVNGLKVQVRDR